MNRFRKLKTPALIIVVILVTFVIFTILPAVMPEFKYLNCQGLWCRGNVTTYHTWFWDDAEQPAAEAIEETLLYLEDTEGLRLIGYKGPAGALSVRDDETRITVSGYLQYGTVIQSENSTESVISQLPVLEGYRPNSPITVRLVQYLDGDMAETKFDLVTDDNGFFSKDVDLIEGVTCFNIGADYRGELISSRNLTVSYLPSWVLYSTCGPVTVDNEGIPWWVWLSIVIFTIGLSFLVYRLLKGHHGTASDPYLPIELEEEKPARKSERPALKSDPAGEQIEISFPEIEEGLPSVWGVDKPLNMIVRQRETIDVPGSSNLVVDFGDGSELKEQIDESARILVTHTYQAKGDYQINVRYPKGTFSGRRALRVVDYREEIVRLFNDLLSELSFEYIEMNAELTAREVELVLLNKLGNEFSEIIAAVVAGFEKANYSTGSIDRESYVSMYKVVEKLRDHNG